MHILARFNRVICLCNLSFSGSSSIFLYNASNILSLISAAAAFVNVTTNILSISMPSFITLFIILSTSTAVFPLPAAAATNIFSPFSYIACFCSSVQFGIFSLLSVNVRDTRFCFFPSGTRVFRLVFYTFIFIFEMFYFLNFKGRL